MPDLTAIRQALSYVEQRPQRPVALMALTLDVDVEELELRLLAAAHAGWVTQTHDGGCCKQHAARFEITPQGSAALRAEG